MREKLIIIFYSGGLGGLISLLLREIFHIKIFGMIALIFFGVSAIILLIAIVLLARNRW